MEGLTLEIVETVLITVGFVAELNGARLILEEVNAAKTERLRARQSMLSPPISGALATGQAIVGNPATIPLHRIRSAQLSVSDRKKRAERHQAQAEVECIDESIGRQCRAVRSLAVAAVAGIAAALLAVWA